MALDAPDAVHSLALLEPALMSVPSVQTSRAFLGNAVQLYRAGDKAGAIDTFLRGLRAELPSRVGSRPTGAFDQHVADADTFFGQEYPPCNSGRSRGRTHVASPSRSLRS